MLRKDFLINHYLRNISLTTNPACDWRFCPTFVFIKNNCKDLKTDGLECEFPFVVLSIDRPPTNDLSYPSFLLVRFSVVSFTHGVDLLDDE